MTKIVDTNVILVANGQHANVGPDCICRCSQQLAEIQRNGRIAIDDQYLILKEYQNKTNPRQGNRVGDAFVKWLLHNSRNPARCDQVAVTQLGNHNFEEFPDDPQLANFDPPDRKFVAVAVQHTEHPPILQAADSKWLDWSPVLSEHGVNVEFLCPQDIRRFQETKFGS